MSINLESELTELRRSILTMSATVERRLGIIVEAMADRDYDAAKKVRHGDAEIDSMEIDIEAACLRILALSQPVASDLRFVLAVLRINSDLERIGDLSKSVAKRVLGLRKSPTLELPEGLEKMGHYAADMVSRAITSLADESVGLAEEVRRADQRLDDLQKEVFAWAHRAIPAHVELTEGAIEVLSIARSIERIGDLATNIAEDVIFLVEGAVVRHT